MSVRNPTGVFAVGDVASICCLVCCCLQGETHDNRPVTRQNAGSISPGPFSIGWGATTRTPAKTGTGGGGSPIVTGAGNSYSPAADYQKVASAHKRGSGGGSAGSSSGGRSQRGAKKVD